MQSRSTLWGDATLNGMSDEAELTGAGSGGPNELAKAYDPSAIEEKWAKYWVDERLFDTLRGAPRARRLPCCCRRRM